MPKVTQLMMKPKLFLPWCSVFAIFLVIARLATASADSKTTINENGHGLLELKETQAQTHSPVAGKPLLLPHA